MFHLSIKKSIRYLRKYPINLHFLNLKLLKAKKVQFPKKTKSFVILKLFYKFLAICYIQHQNLVKLVVVDKI